MTSSCSFRITRTTEDLARTINALSQRLVKLEQRQDFLESRLKEDQKEPSLEELRILDDVDQLLQDSKELLDDSSISENDSDEWSTTDESDILAA